MVLEKGSRDLNFMKDLQSSPKKNFAVQCELELCLLHVDSAKPLRYKCQARSY